MAYRRKKGKSFVKKNKSFSYKGINYKSSLEKNMAILLTKAGIKFEYEPTSFDLIETFHFPFDSYERQANGKGDMINRGNKKVRAITYKPDFIGDGFIIETKGYANETFPLKWKLFKKMLVDNGFNPESLVIYKPQKISECIEVVELIKKQNDKERN